VGGGAVEYGRGDCIRLWRRKIDKDKACEIVGLAAQMRRVTERGNECVARLMRLALNRQGKFARVEPTSYFEL